MSSYLSLSPSKKSGFNLWKIKVSFPSQNQGKPKSIVIPICVTIMGFLCFVTLSFRLLC